MQTNGNGDHHRRFSHPDQYDFIWYPDDPAVQETAGLMANIKPDWWPLRDVSFQVLGFIKRLRTRLFEMEDAVRYLFESAFFQQRDLRHMEEELKVLRAQVDTLLREKRERTTEAALEALEDGEDVGAVLDRMREPVTAAEERVREMEGSDAAS